MDGAVLRVELSQLKRKGIEETFGWLKTMSGMRAQPNPYRRLPV
jgi:hypothetical protein